MGAGERKRVSLRVIKTTVTGAMLGTGAHGGYYAIATWLPTFLFRERDICRS